MNIARFCGLVLLGVIALPVSAGGVARSGDAGPEDAEARLEIGKELFTREWVANDKRTLAGDGLGPVFNERSCAKCHVQGGVGGSGPKANNVGLIGAFVDLSSPGFSAGASVRAPDPKAPVEQPDRNQLAEIHPALLTGGSFPAHRFGTAKAFEEWKTKFKLESQDLNSWERLRVDGVRIALIRSDRNTPALFGSGLLDQIPSSVLDAVEAAQAKAAKSVKKEDLRIPENQQARQMLFRDPLPITGRVARLQVGKVGRFGWKASVASLSEFTLQACANEIGLEVPGVPRAVPPWIKNYKAPGLDLSADQCACLTEFVAALPRPRVRKEESKQQELEIAAGAKVFDSLGCAACHRRDLGEVSGVYSDLLLHDMGQGLSGSGGYETNVEFVKTPGKTDPLPVNRNSTGEAKREKPPQFGASTREWRTPPLWGVRDSAPYLHDGRAQTLAVAIRWHDGEGAMSAVGFEMLSERDQKLVIKFLETLAAPDAR